MKYLPVIIVFIGLCLPNTSKAQDVPVLMEEAMDWLHSDLDSSISYWQRAQQVAESNAEWRDSLYPIYYYLCQLHYFKKDSASTQYADKALKICADCTGATDLFKIKAEAVEFEDIALADSLFKRGIEVGLILQDSGGVAACHSQYGDLHFRSGDFVNALNSKLVSLDYTSAPLARANSLAGIASVFLEIGLLDRAEEFSRSSIEICQSHGFSCSRDIRTVVLAMILTQQGAEDEAQILLESVDQNAKNSALAQLVSARIARNRGNTEYALQHLLKGLADETISSLYYEGNIHLELAQCYKELNDYPLATRHAQRGLEIGKSLHSLNLVSKAMYVLSDLSMEDSRRSLSYLQEANTISDSLNSVAIRSEILASEREYDRREKQMQIDLLSVSNELKVEEIKKRNILIVLTVGGLLGLSFLLFLIIKKNRRISDQHEVISKNVKEKELLLREIHHRVKNNLQVISSLLRLQRNDLDKKSPDQILLESQNRVDAMSIIHQNLYTEHELENISIPEYLAQLVQNLFNTYNIDSQKISLVKNIDPISLPLDLVVPVGLILNELLSNALKYAFVGQEMGKIEVSFRQVEDQLELSVIDDGIGLYQQNSQSQFGMTLVEALVEKLEGELKINGLNGSEFQISFPGKGRDIL